MIKFLEESKVVCCFAQDLIMRLGYYSRSIRYSGPEFPEKFPTEKVFVKLRPSVQWYVQITNHFIFRNSEINNELSQSSLFPYFPEATKWRSFYNFK